MLTCAVALAVTATHAQQPQTVEVTGSRILRSELGGTVPAVTVDTELLGALGVENFADMATQLPQFGAVNGASRTQSTTSSPLSTGLNLVNLRNLGFTRSLVLINGRRTVGGTSTSNGVDFNTVPTANIQRIDVITGGASAVYGSDAISGVINIVTRRNVEGIEVGVGYGRSQRGGNENPTGHVLWGGRFGDQGRWLATLQVDHQGQVSCRDRELCDTSFQWTVPSSPLRGPAAYSQVGVVGRYFVGNASYTRRNGSLVDANGRLIPFVTEIDGYDAAPERDLAIPTRRAMAALEGEFALGPGLRGYGELNHGRVEVTSRFDSFGFQSQAQGSLFGTLQATIPLDNPYIPTALRAAVDAFNATATPAQRITALTWWKRFESLGGPRGATSERETTRLLFGVRGDAPMLGSDWRWDLYHVEGRTDNVLRARGLVSTANLYHGLRVEPDPAAPGRYRCIDAAARAAGCVAVNPFADDTADVQNALRVDAVSSGRGTLADTVGYLAGPVAELPAGTMDLVVGVEQRRTSGYLDVATVTNLALASGTPIADTDYSAITTRELFVETRVPVLAGRPGVRALNVEAAFRRSVSARTSYDTWKVGGDWEPAAGLRLRAMRARAVRAPEARDLSGGGFVPAATITDPCAASRRTASATRAANCAADGVPSSYVPPAAVEAAVPGLAPANADLTPEIGTTVTMGLVWEPPQVAGLSLALDRFRIEVQDAITSVARQVAVDRCYDTVERQFCASVGRGSHPLVPGASYVLVRADQRTQNAATQQVGGADLDIRYRWKTETARYELGALGTYYDRAVLIPLAGSAPIVLLGKAGGTANGWIRKTALAHVGWASGPYRATWSVRHVGSADMAVGTTAQGYPRLPDMTYHNLRLAYAPSAGHEAYIGVTNIGDRKPPLFASGTSGTAALDTVPGYYDVFGRSFFVGARMTFQ